MLPTLNIREIEWSEIPRPWLWKRYTSPDQPQGLEDDPLLHAISYLIEVHERHRLNDYSVTRILAGLLFASEAWLDEQGHKHGTGGKNPVHRGAMAALRNTATKKLCEFYYPGRIVTVGALTQKVRDLVKHRLAKDFGSHLDPVKGAEDRQYIAQKERSYLEDKAEDRKRIFIRDGRLWGEDHGALKPLTTAIQGGALPYGWGYVMTLDHHLYADSHGHLGREKHIVHARYTRGAPVLCAGWLVAEDGKLLYIDNASGHYKPTDAKLAACVHWLYVYCNLSVQTLMIHPAEEGLTDGYVEIRDLNTIMLNVAGKKPLDEEHAEWMVTYEVLMLKFWQKTGKHTRPKNELPQKWWAPK